MHSATGDEAIRLVHRRPRDDYLGRAWAPPNHTRILLYLYCLQESCRLESHALASY